MSSNTRKPSVEERLQTARVELARAHDALDEHAMSPSFTPVVVAVTNLYDTVQTLAEAIEALLAEFRQEQDMAALRHGDE